MISIHNDITLRLEGDLNSSFYNLTPNEKVCAINLGIIGLQQLKTNYHREQYQEQEQIIKKEYDELLINHKNKSLRELNQVKIELDYLQSQNQLKNQEINENNQKFQQQLGQQEIQYQHNLKQLQEIKQQELIIYQQQIKQLQDQLLSTKEDKNNQLIEQKEIFQDLLNKEKDEKNRIQQQFETSLSSIQVLNNSCQKGKVGENQIEDILNQYFGEYQIENCSKKPHQGDYHIKKSNTTLMLEIKNYDSEKIRTSQIDKFYNDLNFCQEHKIPIQGAIFISMNNEIVGKKSLEFEIYKNIPVVFLSSLANDIDRLFCCINFIEKYLQISQLKNQENQAFLLNYIMSKLSLITQSIDNLDQEKKYFEDIQTYIRQKSDRYLKEHQKNMSFIKDIFSEIEHKINNCQLTLDAEEDYFMSLTDPNDISKNLLQTLQKKYLLNKFNNNGVLSSTQSINSELLTNEPDLTENQITRNNLIIIPNTEIIIEEFSNQSNSNEDNQLSSGSSSKSFKSEQLVTIDLNSNSININTDDLNSVTQNEISNLDDNVNRNGYSNNYPEKHYSNNNKIKAETIENWKQTFNWLQHNSEGVLYCTRCSTQFKNCLKKSVFDNHQKSKQHLEKKI